MKKESRFFEFDLHRMNQKKRKGIRKRKEERKEKKSEEPKKRQ